MTPNPIHYRNLPTWKYQLETAWTYQTKITGFTTGALYFDLFPDGELNIYRGYCWDGPSGPTFDTKDFMRGALVHDVLYQMLRQGDLPPSYRKAADQELAGLLKSDGMFWLRRKYVYLALRAFAGGAAKAKERPVQTAP